MVEKWNIGDFVANGRFAPPSFLRSILNKVRKASEAHCAILIVCQPPMVFQSLFYVDSDDAKLARQLETALVEVNMLDEDSVNTRRFLADYQIEWSTVPRPVRLLFDKYRTVVFDIIERSFDTNTLGVFVPCLTPQSDVVAEIDKIYAGVLAISPRQTSMTAKFNRSLRSFGDALCCTEALFLRRRSEQIDASFMEMFRLFDVAAANSIKNELQLPEERHSVLMPFSNDTLLQFMRVVINLTNAHRASLYFTDRRSDITLVCRAIRDGDGVVRLQPRSNEKIPREAPAVVPRTFRDGRAILINDPDEFRKMYRSAVIAAPPGANAVDIVSELAVPLCFDNNAYGNPITLGVVNLERVKNHSADANNLVETVFTYLDCRFTEQAAARFMAAWSRSCSNQLRNVLSTVAFARGSLLGSSILPVRSVDDRPTHDRSLPEDFALMRDRLNELLPLVLSAIPLLSLITIRVLSFDRSSLTLLCASPSVHEPSIPPERCFETSGVPLDGITRIMHRCMAQQESLSTLGGESELKLFAIESLLCSPVIVEKQSVGVITFASRLPAGLAAFSDELKAVADVVSTILSAARTSLLLQIVGMQAHMFSCIHTIGHIPERLNGHVDTISSLFRHLDGPVQQELQAAHSAIEEISKEGSVLKSQIDKYWESKGRSAEQLTLAGKALTPKSLIERALGMWDTDSLFTTDYTTETAKNAILLPEVFDAAVAAFREVIANAIYYYEAVDAAPECVISLNEAKQGAFAEFCFRQQFHVAPNRLLLASLFRIPIRKYAGDRLHVGAFLAASLVRSVGGDIYIRNTPIQMIEVIVQIPAE